MMKDKEFVGSHTVVSEDAKDTSRTCSSSDFLMVCPCNTERMSHVLRSTTNVLMWLGNVALIPSMPRTCDNSRLLDRSKGQL